MDKDFYDLTIKINSINRSFHDYLGKSLHENDFRDISPNNALIIKNIGSDRRNVDKTSAYGYNVGSNISYNIADLTKKGYIVKDKDAGDMRSVYLVLTERGLKVLGVINEAILSQQNSLIAAGISGRDIKSANSFINKLEEFFVGR